MLSSAVAIEEKKRRYCKFDFHLALGFPENES